MADIKVTADITDIKQLNQLLDKTEAKVSQVATKSATAFGAYTKSVNGSLQAVRNKMTFSTRMARQQSSEYAKAATEVNRQIALSKKFAAQKAQEEAVTAAASRNTANANRRLRMEFREGYAAQVQYRAGQMRLNQAQRLGMVTAEQYKVQLAVLHTQLLKNTAAGVANGERMRATGLVMQQTGYQVGDFLVQVQGGTNVMVAFGQQATQLAGLLTVLGKSTALIALGAALSVLIPLTTAAAGVFLRARREADETTEAVNELNNAIESLDSTLQNFAATKRAAAAGMTVAEMFGGDSVEQAIRDLEAARADLERSTENRGRGSRVGRPDDGGFFETYLERYEAALVVVTTAEERLATLRAMQGEDTLAAFEAQDLALSNQFAMQQRIAQYGEDSNAVRQLQLSQSIDQYNAARDAQFALNELTFDHGEQLKASYAELQRFNYAQESVLREQELAEQATERLADQMERAANAAMSFLNRIRSGVSGIAGLQAEVAALEAGATSGQASAAGDVANLRDDPAYQLLLAGGPTNELAQADALIAEAGRLIELKSTLQDRVSELTRTESAAGSGSSGSSLSDQAAEAVASLQAQFALQEALRGQTEEHILVRRALGDSYSQIGAAQIASLEEQARLIAVVTEADEQRVRLNETVANSVASGLASMVDGTVSVKEAFKDMARSIIKELYDIFVVQQLVNSISGAFGGIGGGKGAKGVNLKSADGNVFSGGSQIQAYANGGVVDRPTYFPMSGGKTGLMSESGPEAIMPLKRGSNGKLGVEASGSGSQAVNITQNFSFSANGDETVKRIIAEAAPQIANLTQKQIMDQRRRGGSMKSTFG
jgi:hypothetical protein